MEDLQSTIAKAQSGDLDAYGQLVRGFQGMACGYAYSILGDFHLAEDAAQDAFIQAYRELGSLRELGAATGNSAGAVTVRFTPAAWNSAASIPAVSAAIFRALSWRSGRPNTPATLRHSRGSNK